MGHILALGSDIFALILVWKGFQMVRKRQQKLFETESDFKLRRLAGMAIICLGIVGIIADHFFFSF